jgi:hypothetical protein
MLFNARFVNPTPPLVGTTFADGWNVVLNQARSVGDPVWDVPYTTTGGPAQFLYNTGNFGSLFISGIETVRFADVQDELQ